MSKVIDSARSGVSRMRAWFGALPGSTKTVMGVGVMVVIIALLLTVAIFSWGRAPKTDTDAYRDLLVDTGGRDLPAEIFAGWVGVPREDPPEVAGPDAEITDVRPGDCAPGGDLHRQAQEVSRSWASGWSGETLHLSAYNAQMDVDISNQEPQSLSGIDVWTAACPHTTFVKDEVEHVQKIQTLPVGSGHWEMDDSRVHVVTLTRIRDGRNLGSTTTLYVVSRYRELTMSGAMTIRGSVTDDALSTLNLLWERQAMKVRAEH